MVYTIGNVNHLETNPHTRIVIVEEWSVVYYEKYDRFFAHENVYIRNLASPFRFRFYFGGFPPPTYEQNN